MQIKTSNLLLQFTTQTGECMQCPCNCQSFAQTLSLIVGTAVLMIYSNILVMILVKKIANEILFILHLYHKFRSIIFHDSEYLSPATFNSRVNLLR